MKIIFSFLLIIFLAFSWYHLSFRRLRLPLFARRFYLTGTEFLFLGLLLGPGLLNLLDADTQSRLAPLSALVLGWIGLLFGFQFEIAKLKRVPGKYLKGAGVSGFMTLILVFFGAWWGLPKIFDLPKTMDFICALTLAAAASCTAQVGLALTPAAKKPGNKDTTALLQYISSADGALAIAAFGLAFFFRPAPLGAFAVGGMWQGIVICIGAELFLFILFLNKRLSKGEIMIVVMGMSILGSGIASMLCFSPLVTNFFVGFFLVNFTRDKERIYGMLASVEKPVYLLMLVFLGAAWRLDTPKIFAVAIAYFVWRAASKIIAGFIMTRAVRPLRRFPAYVGLGLMDHGGIALAILLDFGQSFSPQITAPVVSMALVAVVLNEITGPGFLRLVFKKGEK